MARRLSDDIVEIGPAFPDPIRGKNDFFKKYQSYLTGPTRIVSYRILRPRIIRLASNLVLVHFSYRMRIETGGAEESSHGKESMLVERRGGRWLVRFIHWHRD
jgi:hypothetical protein